MSSNNYYSLVIIVFFFIHFPQTEIMENHILRLTFCSAAVIDDDSRVSAFNMLGEKMTLERNSSDEDNSTDNEINTTSESSMNILVNGKSRILEEDLMATNGVIHVSFKF
jgi:uncharacterized surface protein with fasciclin (FAS1) repeats